MPGIKFKSKLLNCAISVFFPVYRSIDCKQVSRIAKCLVCSLINVTIIRYHLESQSCSDHSSWHLACSRTVMKFGKFCQSILIHQIFSAKYTDFIQLCGTSICQFIIHKFVLRVKSLKFCTTKICIVQMLMLLLNSVTKLYAKFSCQQAKSNVIAFDVIANGANSFALKNEPSIYSVLLHVKMDNKLSNCTSQANCFS